MLRISALGKSLIKLRHAFWGRNESFFGGAGFIGGGSSDNQGFGDMTATAGLAPHTLLSPRAQRRREDMAVPGAPPGGSTQPLTASPARRPDLPTSAQGASLSRDFRKQLRDA